MFVLPVKVHGLVSLPSLFKSHLFSFPVNSDIDDVHNDLLHLDIWSVVMMNARHIPSSFGEARLSAVTLMAVFIYDGVGADTLTCRLLLNPWTRCHFSRSLRHHSALSPKLIFHPAPFPLTPSAVSCSNPVVRWPDRNLELMLASSYC